MLDTISIFELTDGMALSKADLKQVKEIVDEAAGGLAEAIHVGFVDVYKRLDQLDTRFESLEKSNTAAHQRFDARLDVLERDVAAIRKELITIRRMLDHVVTQSQLTAVIRRVERIENQLGLVKTK